MDRLRESAGSLERAIRAVGETRRALLEIEGTRPLRDGLQGMSEELEGLRAQLDQFASTCRRQPSDRYELTAAGEAWLDARARGGSVREMDWPSRTAAVRFRLCSRSYQGGVDEWAAPGRRIGTWTCGHRHRSEAAACACAERNLHRRLRPRPNSEDFEGCS